MHKLLLSVSLLALPVAGYAAAACCPSPLEAAAKPAVIQVAAAQTMSCDDKGDCADMAECADQAAKCGGMVAAAGKTGAALARDDYAAAQQAAGCLEHCAEGKPELKAAVAAFRSAGSLEAGREQFKKVSALLIPIAKQSGSAHFVMTCPMVKADWVQTDRMVANPFHGSEMLRCGMIRETVAAN
jgi:hypothetical protein